MSIILQKLWKLSCANIVENEHFDEYKNFQINQNKKLLSKVSTYLIKKLSLRNKGIRVLYSSGTGYEFRNYITRLRF